MAFFSVPMAFFALPFSRCFSRYRSTSSFAGFARQVELSNRETFDVTASAVFTVTAANSFSVATNLPVTSGNVLAPVGAGEFVLTATFPAGDLVSNPTTLNRTQ